MPNTPGSEIIAEDEKGREPLKMHAQRYNTITNAEAQKYGLKGKPECPCCGKPLTFICKDVTGGHLNQKCGNCGKPSIVDMSTMEVKLIRIAASYN